MFQRSAPVAKCPNFRHRSAIVHANGTQTRNGRTYRRYRCRPRTGPVHYFTVLIDGTPPRRHSTPPPVCAKHPDGKVVRDGRYARRSERPRQRYRCHPADGSKRHRFTPPLPRGYTGHGFDEPCELCELTPDLHLGEPAVARRHPWSSRTPARGLMLLSRGETYGDTGAWAQRRVDSPRTRARSGPATNKRPASAAANARWHIGADWVDCYGPVIWEPLEAEMRARAVAERHRVDADLDAGRALERPLIWIADEQPIHGKSDELFCVLVVAECEWISGQEEPLVRLRVARAMPDRTAASWRLVFEELAGPEGPDRVWPDFLVADASAGIEKGLEAAFRGRTRWVPSLWHLGTKLRFLVLGRTPAPGRTDFPALEAHLSRLSRGSDAVMSVEGWARWWDEADSLLRSMGVVGRIRGREVSPLETRRRIYEPAYAAVIPDLGSSFVPLSNAALEELIKSKIRPLFHKRSQFTSIERTNRLTDLAVAASRGRLDDELEVARLLRADAHAHDGRTTEPRAIADPACGDRPGRNRSLRDATLPTRLLTHRGLA